MIYSQWRSDGGYDYYATADRRALGSDLPTPRLTGTSPIGVPSVDIGRPLPSGARKVGAGPIAKGQIVPMSRAGVSGMLGATIGATDFVLLSVAVVFGWWVRGALAKRAL